MGEVILDVLAEEDLLEFLLKIEELPALDENRHQGSRI